MLFHNTLTLSCATNREKVLLILQGVVSLSK